MANDYAPLINSELAQLCRNYPDKPVEYTLPKVSTINIASAIVVPAGHKPGGRIIIPDKCTLKALTDFDGLIRVNNYSYGSGNISQWNSMTKHLLDPDTCAFGATTVKLAIPAGNLPRTPFHAVIFDHVTLVTGEETYYVHQQLVKVVSYNPATGVATLEEPLGHDFITSGGNPPELVTTVDTLVGGPWSVEGAATISGRETSGNAQVQQLVWFGACYGPSVKGLLLTGHDTDAIRFEFCSGASVSQCQFADSTTSGGGLGRHVAINNSYNVSVEKCAFKTGRHSVMISIGSSKVRASNNESASTLGDVAWDAGHGLGARDLVFEACNGGEAQAGNGTYLHGGKDVTFKNMTVTAVRLVGNVDGVTIENVTADTFNVQATESSLGYRPRRIRMRDSEFHLEDQAGSSDPFSVVGIGASPWVSVDDFVAERCSFSQAATGGGRRCVLIDGAQTKIGLRFIGCQFVNAGTGVPIRIHAGTPNPNVQLWLDDCIFRTGAAYGVELGANTAGYFRSRRSTLAAGGASGLLLNSGTASTEVSAT